MAGYLIIWVFFFGLALLIGVLVLIQLIRNGIARLTRGPAVPPQDPPRP